MDGRLDKTATCTAPIQLKQLGGSVSLDKQDKGLLSFFEAYVSLRRRQAYERKQLIRAARLHAARWVMPATEWHPDAHSQPGETE